MGETHAEATARADKADARAEASDVRAAASHVRADAADARADASDRRADLSEARSDHLDIALESRDAIGMAKGILMHAEGVGPNEAFQILVRASQDQNRTRHDIAAELVLKYPETDA